MTFTTRGAWVAALIRIRGVKSASIQDASQGVVLVSVRYRFWTYLWPGLNRKVSKRVRDTIYNHKPVGVSIGGRVAK
jgi:hypothetical protein